MGGLNQFLDKPKSISGVVISAVFLSYLLIVGLPPEVHQQEAWGFMLALMLGGYYASRYIFRVLRTGWFRLVLVLSCVVGLIFALWFDPSRQGVIVMLFVWVAFMLLLTTGVGVLVCIYRWVAEGFSVEK